MTRTQTGYIYKNKGSWDVRFYQDEVQPSGEVRRRQRACGWPRSVRTTVLRNRWSR